MVPLILLCNLCSPLWMGLLETPTLWHMTIFYHWCHSSFFGYDNEKDLKVSFLMTRVSWHAIIQTNWGDQQLVKSQWGWWSSKSRLIMGWQHECLNCKWHFISGRYQFLRGGGGSLFVISDRQFFLPPLSAHKKFLVPPSQDVKLWPPLFPRKKVLPPPPVGLIMRC